MLCLDSHTEPCPFSFSGGWSAIQATGLKGSKMRSDERILGDGDFVDAVLSENEEKFERTYALRRSGYDLDKIAVRVAALCSVEIDDIFSRNKQQNKVKARSLFCYWASNELGISYTELARRIGISVSGIGYCAERGKLIARENDYQLLEQK
jgi:DNA-binding XRE family transcriptional regulator